MFDAEKRNEAFAGGEADGWRAFPINASSPAPIPWDADALYAYLRRGWHGLHGVAGGPMAPVADNLASVPAPDLKAIAVYVASLMGEPAQERREQGERLAAVARPFGAGGKPQSAGSHPTDCANTNCAQQNSIKLRPIRHLSAGDKWQQGEIRDREREERDDAHKRGAQIRVVRRVTSARAHGVQKALSGQASAAPSWATPP
jgi:hypothetical protein